MKIEICTTKKKISKSLINQMRKPTITTMEKGNVLGYMINAKKDSYKSILIEYMSQYFVVSGGWEKEETEIYRSIGRGTRSIKFETPELCENWWCVYERVLKSAKIQIYV